MGNILVYSKKSIIFLNGFVQKVPKWDETVQKVPSFEQNCSKPYEIIYSHTRTVLSPEHDTMRPSSSVARALT
jgi:hypothetical protein